MRKILAATLAGCMLAVGICGIGGCDKGGSASDLPEITCTAKEGAYTVTQGRAMTEFPLIVCKLNGKTMKASDYTVVDNLDPDAEFDIMKGTYKSDVIGEHEIVVTATNPDDKSKVATTSFKINVYRRICALGNSGNLSAEQWLGDPDDPVPSQYVMMTARDNSLGILSMNAGKLYYAEGVYQGLMTFNESYDLYGFAHVSDFNGVEGVDGLAKVDSARWLASAVQSTSMTGGFMNGCGEKMVTTFADITDWSKVDYNSQVNTFFARHYDQYGTSGYEGTKSVDSTFKYAVARSGNMFYSFINDKLVAAVTSEYFGSVNTVPALYARLHKNAQYEGDDWQGKKISDIDFYDGAKAQDKINELLSTESAIKNWGANFATDATGNGTITVGEKSEQKGVNFTCNATDTTTNSAAVTPDIAFGTDFTLSFDYKPGQVGVSRGEILVDLRNSSWKQTVLQAGAFFTDTAAGGLSFNEGERFDNVSLEFGDTFDASAGVRVVLTRDLQTENSKSVYTVKFISLAKSEHTLEKVYEDESANWNAMIYPVFKNRNISGEWFNIYVSAENIA